MRALQLTAYKGPDALALADVPEPERGVDEVLVDVRAIGVNFPDLLITTGAYQHKPDLPFVPGCEIAGVVMEAPESSDWQPGERVAAFVWDGAYAERAAVPLNALMRLPEGAGFDAGAGMVVNYHTTHFALARRGQLAAGERLLVLGAAGGIGTAAIQVGKALGATVIGGVADEGQLEVARLAGADDALVLSEGFNQEVRARTGGRGVDVVLDPLGDWLFAEGLRSLAPEGRILVVGFAAGAIPEIKVNRLLLRNATAVGVAWGAFLSIDSELMSSTAASLSDMFAAGFVSPQLASRCAFQDLPDALHRLSRGEIRGKLVADPPAV
jgi:NADPH:quinone reductase